MLKRNVVLSMLGLVAVVAAAVAVSVAGSASAHKPSHAHRALHRAHRSAARQASDSAAVLDAFSVLGEPTSGGTPAGAGRKVAAQYPVWVTNEGGEICLVTEGIVGPGIVGSFCATDEQALAGQLIGLAGKYPTHGAESVVIGLAPNGNASVQAADAAGTSQAVSVDQNVYEIVGKAPHTITLRDASGQTTTQEVPGTE